MLTSPVEIVLTFSTGLVTFALATSGISKLGRTSSTLASMAALRVPAGLRRPFVARLLPFGELLLSVLLLLLPGGGRQLSGVVAALLLAIFAVLLVGVIHRGDDVDCGCFGALSFETRVTTWSVVRNVVLCAAATAVATLGFSGGVFLVDLIRLDPTVVLASALGWAMTAIVVLARALFVSRRATGTASITERPGPHRQPAPLSRVSLALGIDPARPGEVAMGDPIPRAELVTDRGHTRLLAELGNGHPTLVIFLSTDCSSCTTVAASVPAWRDELNGVEIRVATSSDPDVLRSAYPQLSDLARYGSRAALAELGVQRSPAAVALGGQQHPVVASPIAYGIVEIAALVQSLASATRSGR